MRLGCACWPPCWPAGGGGDTLPRVTLHSTLDTSYVSSFSFYFLLMFGLRGVYSLILGQDNGALPAYHPPPRPPVPAHSTTASTHKGGNPPLRVPADADSAKHMQMQMNMGMGGAQGMQQFDAKAAYRTVRPAAVGRGRE